MKLRLPCGELLFDVRCLKHAYSFRVVRAMLTEDDVRTAAQFLGYKLVKYPDALLSQKECNSWQIQINRAKAVKISSRAKVASSKAAVAGAREVVASNSRTPASRTRASKVVGSKAAVGKTRTANLS